MNSNKIYIKYHQKINEMSIKNIEDSLNTVNNISFNLEQIDENKGNIDKLKDIKNILFYDEREQIDFRNVFFNKTYELNIKK